MLAIRCQFLNGSYQAAYPGRTGEPEWPPHPARLHMALVAAGWAIGTDAIPDEALAALRWLEAQPAPKLAAGPVDERESPTVFVPRNLTGPEATDALRRLRRGDDIDRQVGRVDRSFPTTIVGDEPTWFIWPSNASEHVSALTRLVREVAFLGSSRSPVCCDVVSDPDLVPPSTLIPARGSIGAGRSMRVPISGFTDMLVRFRHAPAPPTGGLMVAYEDAHTATRQPAPALKGPFGELAVKAFGPRFPLTILHVPVVTHALREAVLSHAGDDAPAILHGHGRNPHVAFLALANVGHSRSSGEIMGVALAIPRDRTMEEREIVLRAFAEVEALHNLQIGSRTLKPTRERPSRTTSADRWTRPSRRWQTVTPVILDRHPHKTDKSHIDDAVRTTFRNAGLPDPSSIEHSPIPWPVAAVPAAAYGGEGLPRGLRLHLDITFETPVAGPVMAGRGRYFGVGLFAPVGQRDEEDDR